MKPFTAEIAKRKIRRSQGKMEDPYSRPYEDKKNKEESSSLTPRMDKAIEEHNERLKQKKKEKQKEGLFSRLFGSKK